MTQLVPQTQVIHCFACTLLSASSVTIGFLPECWMLIFLFCSSSRWYCPCSKARSKELPKEQVWWDLLLVNCITSLVNSLHYLLWKKHNFWIRLSWNQFSRPFASLKSRVRICLLQIICLEFPFFKFHASVDSGIFSWFLPDRLRDGCLHVTWLVSCGLEFN